MNRKHRRAFDKKLSKEISKNLSEKISQFGNLPEECLTCLKPFDKKNKEMVQTWNVIVKDTDTVRLYCPECWTMATSMAAEYFKSIGSKEKEDAS
jgi:hypothetical protein